MSNQSKTEPMPPTGGHGDPEAHEGGGQAQSAAPGVDHGAMRAGAAPEHAPSHPATVEPEVGPVSFAGTGSPGDTRGVPAVSAEPAPGSSEDSPVVQGLAPGPTGLD